MRSNPLRISLALLPLTAAPLALAQEGAPLFDNAQYFVGDNPQHIVTGDLDGDGRLDMVTSNFSSNDVSVLLANGAGGFRAARHYPVFAQPHGLALGDCDGDGILDIGVACESIYGFVILLGQGDGSFGPPLAYNSGTRPFGIAFADFDNDGRLDVATANYGNGTSNWSLSSVGVCFGDGQGWFSPPTEYTVGSGPRSVVAGDFNGDGKLDIAAANYDPFASGISVLLNLGGGVFGPASTFSAGGAESHSLHAGDVNGDGALDLVAAKDYVGGGYGVLLIGNGWGSFQGPTFFAMSTNSGSVTLGDLNRDGKADVVGTGTGPTRLRVHWGSASGALVPGPNVLIAGEPRSVVTGDFDQDGIIDVATANGIYADNVSVLLRDAQGEFRPPPRYPAGSDPRRLLAADFNGDGFPDLATVMYGGNTARVMLNNGMGGFPSGTEYPVGLRPSHLAAADLDGDGKLDLVVANYWAHTLTLLKGVGNGAFSSWQTLPVGGLHPAWVAIADLDGSGWPDIVSANLNTNDVSVFLGLGGGGFSAPERYAAGLAPYSIRIQDLDGDGALDLAMTNIGASTAPVLSGDRAGGFRLTQTIALSASSVMLDVADLDQDGRPDLLVTCTMGLGTDGTLDVLLQDTNGIFQPAGTYFIGGAANEVAAMDFDQDGLPDALIASGSSSNAILFLSDGEGGFRSATGYVVGTPTGCGLSPGALAVADYDRDGRLDGATIETCGGPEGVVVLFNRFSDAPGIPMCFGAGVAGKCPCGNSGTPGRGCDNSAATGGARLEASGKASLSSDTLVFTSNGEPSTALTIFLQGSTYVDHAPFGDGLRCAGGVLQRLYVKNAAGGTASAPQPGDPSVSSRASLSGNPLSAGAIRVYQAFYRDPSPTFCPAPPGGSFNISSGQEVVWTH